MTALTDPVRRRRRRERLTHLMVAALPKREKRYTVLDPEQHGHYIRVMPKGPNVYVAVARDTYGKQVWATLGNADVLKIEEARERARAARLTGSSGVSRRSHRRRPKRTHSRPSRRIGSGAKPANSGRGATSSASCGDTFSRAGRTSHSRSCDAGR